MPGKYFFLFYIFIFCNLDLVNKFKFWGLVAAVATLLTVFGAWSKITHQAYADKLLAMGLCLFGISQAVYHYLKFIKLKNKDEQ